MPALNIEYADAFAAQHQRNSQFRTHIIDRVDISRIVQRIADAHWVAARCRRSADSLPEWYAEIRRKVRRITNRESMLQVRTIALEHQNAENLVVDMPFDQRCRTRQHFVEIKRRVDLFADLGERRQDLGGGLRSGIFSQRAR